MILLSNVAAYFFKINFQVVIFFTDNTDNFEVCNQLVRERKYLLQHSDANEM